MERQYERNHQSTREVNTNNYEEARKEVAKRIASGNYEGVLELAIYHNLSLTEPQLIASAKLYTTKDDASPNQLKLAQKALRKAGMKDEAKQLEARIRSVTEKVFGSRALTKAPWNFLAHSLN